MWFSLRGALAALAVLALSTSTASAEGLEFISSFGPKAEVSEAEVGDCGCDVGCLDNCGGCCDPWCLRDSMYGFFAFDGWKDQADYLDGNNFGFRTGVNAGIPLLRSRGIGAQIGASVGLYELSGREQGATTTVENQTIFTVGAFKRSDYCAGERFSWAIAYDHRFNDAYGVSGGDSLSLGQYRGLIGYALNPCDEIGFWMTQTNGDDDPLPATTAGIGLIGVSHWSEPVQQYNFFWRRYWECGGETMLYMGAVEDPGEFVVGLDAQVPLSRRLSLFCGANYIKPSVDAGSPNYTEEIWNVSAGLMFFPGRCAQSCCGPDRWTPLLPVANNGTFALDVDTRPVIP